MKVKILNTIIILTLAVALFGFPKIYAQTQQDLQGLTIFPAKIDLIENKYTYDVSITNNDDYPVNLSVSIEKLNKLGDELGQKLNIKNYVMLTADSIFLEPGKKQILTVGINPEIKNSDKPLYGDLVIKTKNQTSAQATIDHGFAIPIYRNIASSYLSNTLEIKNVQFKNNFFDFAGESKVSFDVVNTGESIVKIYGVYDIKNGKNEVISSTQISTNDYVLYPGESRNFNNDISLTGFLEKYQLNIAITDGSGEVIKKSSSDLLFIHPFVILSILVIIVLIILLILKGRSIRRMLKEKGLYKLIRSNAYKRLQKGKTLSIIILIISLTVSFPITAQTMNSTNFSIPDSGFSSGANSTSTSFRLRDEQGGSGSSTSTSFGITAGKAPLDYAFVPPAPSVSNNSGIYYDRLNVIINQGTNPSDADYAIQVTSPSFTGSRYVQNDNTLGSSLDNITGWRRYSTGSPNWNSTTGTVVTGLSPNTSYTFYVKARQRYNQTCALSSCNIPASETPVILSPAANATPNTTQSTSTSSLAFQIIGVSSGGSNTVTSTSTSASFGTLSSGTPQQASNTLRVTTNASNGYNISMKVNQKLTYSSKTIDWFTGSGNNATFSVPQLWSSPTGTTFGTFPTTGWIGYHTDNTNVSQFNSGGTKFAPFPVSPSSDQIVTYTTAQNNTPVDDNISYKVEINTGQPAGKYSGMTITYILTGSF